MLLNPWNRTARFVLTGLALCVIVIGACTTETTTDVEVGKQLKMDLEAADADHVEGQSLFIYEYISSEDLTHKCKEMSELLSSQPCVEDASVSISQQSTGEVSLDILTWGSHVDGNELVSTLKNSYPALADAAVIVRDLSTTIRESIVSKIGRRVLNIEASGSDPEQLRLQVLEQLAAQGYDGHAEVNVETDGDQQTITIEMEEE